MAFIVEDGTIVANANAYIDIAFANEYFTDRGNNAWIGDDSVKQIAIIKATDYIDTMYDFKGFLVSKDQSLKFPRLINCYKDNEIPLRLKKACCEYAVRALENGVLITDPTYDASGRNIKRVKQKLDTLESETEYFEYTREVTQRVYPIPDKLIEPLLKESGSVTFITR